MGKFIFLLGLALLCQVCSAQSPLAFPYQAVARDSFGTPIPGQAMRIRLTIHDSSATGPIRYRETDSIVTDNLGMFTVNIGEGAVDIGTFSNINWGSAAKYLQVELDPAGGASYINMGASQLLSVPFALHAGGSGNIKTVSTTGNYSVETRDSSVILSATDTSGARLTSFSAGQMPYYGINQVAAINFSNAGGSAGMLIMDNGATNPNLIIGSSKKSSFTGHGGFVQLIPTKTTVMWKKNSENVHGIEADSLSLKLYSSLDSLRSWTWPNLEGINGQALTTNGTGTLGWSSIPKKNRFGITIDGLGDVITIGSKGFTEIPYNGTITGWTIVADQAGSCVIDVKRSNYASFPTTTSIAGTALPTLFTAQKNKDATLSGWGSTTINAGDMFEFIVSSATSVKRVTLIIETTME